MGLFSSHKAEQVPVQTAPPPARNSLSNERRGLFHSKNNRSTSPISNTTTTTTKSSSTNGGLFHRNNHEDPAISSARQRVADAENAERNADRALVAARASVREARARVKQLELDAKEEARLARIKQQQAANISERARPLGRHGG